MKNLVKNFLKYFFILIAAYHIIVTILGYGIFGGNFQSIISIIRDALWIIFVLLVAIRSDEGIKGYMKKWGKVWILFVILILFSVGISYLKGISISNMLIGIKYGFYFLLIFLTSTFIGYVGIEKFDTKDFSRIQYLMMGILGLGFIWQLLKIVKPELFYSIGYGKLDDFVYGINPPIYYLTGYEGIMRWQGIFAGPNNYGYFLVAFLPLILLFWGDTLQDLKKFLKNPINNMNLLLAIFWFIAIILTLSRSAILGTAIIVAFLSKNWIKEHKKLSIGILGVLILGIVGLSFLKSESTIGHFESTLSYVGEITNHPFGHGLGSSGPAIHHEGTMLPENYFMQIMLDVGTIGFILWCVAITGILMIFKAIENHVKKSKISTEESIIYLQWKRLYVGFATLLVIGLFLHVFEDSMVNYLFFGLFGLYTGYLSKFITVKDKSNFKDFLRK